MPNISYAKKISWWPYLTGNPKQTIIFYVSYAYMYIFDLPDVLKN